MSNPSGPNLIQTGEETGEDTKCERTFTLQTTVKVCRNFGSLPVAIQQTQIEDTVRQQLKGLDVLDGWSVSVETIEVEGE